MKYMADRKSNFEVSNTEEFRKIRMKRHTTPHSTVSTRRAPKKKKKSGIKTALVVFVAVLLLLLLAGCGVFGYFKYLHRPDSDSGFLNPTPENVLVDDTGTPVPSSTLRDGRYNFLAVGCDRKEWLSDVIMLATYDVKEKSVAIMQIPRDTYVTVTKKLQLDDNGSISSANFDGKSGYGCKINAVLGHGGGFAGTELKRLVGLAADASASELEKICKDSFLDIDSKTLKSYMSANGSEKSDLEYKIKLKFAIKYLSALLYHCYGVPTDFYAQVNLDGFVNIVDAVGGVDVYVQEDMNYDDPYQDLHIHIKAGNQHLDGKAAEGFIRFRYGYAAADIARIDAQKIFMTAFIKKVMSIDGIKNLNELVKEVSANLNTNISLSDILYFATNALDLDLSKVVMLTMPGSPQYINKVSYYLVNKQVLMKYVNTYLNKYTDPLTEDDFIVVQSTSKNTGRDPLTATDITEDQPDLGFLHSSSKKTNTAAASTPKVETPAEPAAEEYVPDSVPEGVVEPTDPSFSGEPESGDNADPIVYPEGSEPDILPPEEDAPNSPLPDGLAEPPKDTAFPSDMDGLIGESEASQDTAVEQDAAFLNESDLAA